ncbi:MAG: PGF-CTERM sorting domain-containing protein [Halobacteriota archaeon]
MGVCFFYPPLTLQFIYIYRPGGGKGVTPTLAPTLTPMATATAAPSLTPTATATPTPGPTAKPWIPGFEAVFAIAGLLAVAYVVLRRKKK